MINKQKEQEAIQHLRDAYRKSRAHSRLARIASAKYGDRGPIISAIVHDHFPERVKNHLRWQALAVGRYLDASRDAWRKSGRRFNTWMREKERVIAEDGRGFYG